MPRAASSNRITIEFKPKGEKQLLAAIKALSVSTTTLSGSQKKLGTSIGLTEKAQKKSIATGALGLRNQRNMNSAVLGGASSFSVFRSKLLLLTFALGLYAMTIGKLTKAAMEQESSERRLSAAIMSTGMAAGLTNHQIFEMTAKIEASGVVADEVNNKVASLLLTFTQIGAPTFERTLKAVNDMAIGMNQGIPQFEQLRTVAIQLGKAMNEPDKQYNALRKSGFSFNEAQVALIKSSMELGDIQTAQNVILEASETQFGGLQEAMRGTSEGAMAALGNAAGTVAEDLGRMLLPMIVSMANALTKLFKALHDNRDMIEKVTITILATGAAIGAVALYAAGAVSGIVAFTAAVALLMVALAPFIAVAAAVGFVMYKILQSSIEARQEARKTAETDKALLVKKLELAQANKELGESLATLDEKLQAVNRSGIIKLNNLKLENADLLSLTETQKKELELQSRALRIEEMLLTVDEEHRKEAQKSVEAIVDKQIAQEKALKTTKDTIKALKESVRIEKEKIKQELQLLELLQQTIVSKQKEKEINKELEKQDFTRIDQLVDFNNGLRKLTGEGMRDFKTAIEEGGDVGSLTFEHLTGTNKEFAIALRDAIVATGSLEAALALLDDKTEELTANQKFLANAYVQAAQAGTEAFGNMVQAQGQLLEQRMEREMEAVKASSEYERATQEQRQIMEDKVERKFKEARKKQFRMEKLSGIATATMNVAEGVTKAYAKGRLGLAALVAALGAAQIAAIAKQPAPRFATGGSFITSGTMPMIVGESGAEKVTIEPLGGRASQTSGVSSNIIINVSAPLVDETILDVIIPKIEEAGKLNLA